MIIRFRKIEPDKKEPKPVKPRKPVKKKRGGKRPPPKNTA